MCLEPYLCPAQAEASAQRGTLLPREKHKNAYDKALVQRYQHMPEIRRIVKHRHLPTAIYKVRPLARRPLSSDLRVRLMMCSCGGLSETGLSLRALEC